MLKVHAPSGPPSQHLQAAWRQVGPTSSIPGSGEGLLHEEPKVMTGLWTMLVEASSSSMAHSFWPESVTRAARLRPVELPSYGQ